MGVACLAPLFPDDAATQHVESRQCLGRLPRG